MYRVPNRQGFVQFPMRCYIGVAGMLGHICVLVSIVRRVSREGLYFFCLGFDL